MRDFKFKFLSLVTSLILVSIFSIASAAQFTTTNGENIDFSHHKGKWIIINYWANWCGSCVSELPVLNKLYQDYQGKDKLLLLGVHFGNSSKQELLEIQQTLGVKYPQLLQDPREHLGITPAKFIPYAVFINPEGNIVKTHSGKITRKQIDNIMKSKA